MRRRAERPGIACAQESLGMAERTLWATGRLFAALSRGLRKPPVVFDVDGEGNFPPRAILRHRSVVGFAPDLVLAHWTGGFLDPARLSLIAADAGAPLALWQVDMAQMTGGCHYAIACDAYRRGCGRCPALASSSPSDRSARQSAARAAVWARHPPIILAQSTWSAEQASRSAVLRGLRAGVIPIPVGEPGFCPPPVSPLPVILARATPPSVAYKGFGLFLEALRLLDPKLGKEGLRCRVVLVGDARHTPRGLAHVEVDARGHLAGPGAMARAYAESSFLVSPSVDDAGPMMVGESMMAGRPVVAYPVGVARDIIVDGLSGRLVSPVGCPAALAAGMLDMIRLGHAGLARMGAAAHEKAAADLTPAAFATRFRSELLRLASPPPS